MKIRNKKSLWIHRVLIFIALNHEISVYAESIETVASTGNVGQYTSLVLDSAGFPVVSYDDALNLDLYLAHCNDSNCAGNNESIINIESAGSTGQYTSLALDSAGFPVISYYDSGNSDLKLVHCNDVNCSGNNESIVTVDSAGIVGLYTSLKLDSSGFPVIGYYDATNGDLKLVHCNDVNCAGNNESITTVESANNVGQFLSLMLDGSGFPVISHYDFTNGDLRLVHCNDANCAGNDESSVLLDGTGSVGISSSLQLDSSGFPVVSYHDVNNADVKLAHCNDVNCAGNNESIVSVDGTGNLGQFTALQLDSHGFPVIGYYDATNSDLKLAHCNDANCVGNDESIATVDSTGLVGQYISLKLDSLGFPVMSYFDSTNSDLKLVHCDDSRCTANSAPVADAGGPYQGAEGQGILLDGTGSSDINLDTLSYQWSVDAPLVCTFDDATLATPTLTCADNGVYAVSLVVNDGVDNSASSSAQVTVSNQNPLCVDLSADVLSIRFGQEISFTGIFGDPGSLDTHQASWDFGDGTIVNEPNAVNPITASHIYRDFGIFIVRLTITDDDNGSCEITLPITVIHKGGGGGSGYAIMPPPLVMNGEEPPSEEEIVPPADSKEVKSDEKSRLPSPASEGVFSGCTSSPNSPIMLGFMMLYFLTRRTRD